MQKILTLNEVLEKLQISRGTLMARIKDGTIKAKKIGRLYRFDLEEIEKLIKGE